MSIIGVVGGIAPESTIAYYRLLVAGYRVRFPDAYPRIVITSIDLSRLLGLVAANELTELTTFLTAEVLRLAQAGAEVAFFASNTPHIVFDAVQARSPIPLISIVEATAAKVSASGVSRVGLLGTRFTMEATFYPAVLGSRGITVEAPDAPDREYVHRVYMEELVNGTFLPETRAGLLAVIGRLRSRAGVEAVILGGTELPLILGEDVASPVPLLDTTRIHAEAILARVVSAASAGR
jgi:aspartate racemase